MKAPLLTFAWVGLGELLLGALALIFAYAVHGDSIRRWRYRFRRAQALLQDSWPLIISTIAVLLYMKIDQIMLREMIGNTAVGIYSAATRISEMWYFLPVAVVSSVTPALIAARQKSEILYYQRLQQLFKLMTGIALMIALPMTFLSTHVVVWLFGKSYETGGPILAIHIWAAVFVFLGCVQSIWDVNEGRTINSLQRKVLGAVINIVLNLVLIPLYAGLGAAVATVVSYAFSAFILNLISSKTRRMFFIQARSFLFFL